MTDAVPTDTVDAGDHACLTFTDLEERLDLVSALVRDGLCAGQTVVCWTDSIRPDELASQLRAWDRHVLRFFGCFLAECRRVRTRGRAESGAVDRGDMR
jgi:hypothetical protein